VNWLVAASFKLTGVRNEWTARLPSVLCVLSVALAFMTIGRRSLGATGSAFAALIWLANFGMIEKGRLIEIEALYVALSGLALICWLSWWRQRRSVWLIWTVPWVFLGLGLLAKGPAHLLFFYSVVIAVLYRSGELRRMFTPAHLVGLFIMAGIFAAWAVPYWLAMGNADVGRNWSVQLTGRLTGADFKLGNWLLNIPRGLAYFLPWTLLLPLLAKTKWANERDRRLAQGLAWGALVPFVIVNLLPGALPRYAMPAIGPACWLMAMILTAPETRWWRWDVSYRWRFVLVLQTAGYAALLLLIYGLALVPHLQSRAKIKPIAEQIDRLIPDSEPLYAVDPDFQPFLFYVRSRLIYVDHLEEVPVSARYLLIQPELEREVMESDRWLPRRAQPIERVTDYRKHTIILARVGDG
jgi:4-amino-4-deoxy-L-arabinose transferase-like glycosyltransferase